MFTIKHLTLEEFDNLVGFWSGAKDRWDNYTQEQKDYLEDYCDYIDFEDLTAVNDFIWFDADDILEEAHMLEED